MIGDRYNKRGEKRESLLSHAVARGVSHKVTGGIEKVSGHSASCTRGKVQSSEVKVTKTTVAHRLGKGGGREREGGRKGGREGGSVREKKKRERDHLIIFSSNLT